MPMERDRVCGRQPGTRMAEITGKLPASWYTDGCLAPWREIASMTNNNTEKVG